MNRFITFPIVAVLLMTCGLSAISANADTVVVDRTAHIVMSVNSAMHLKQDVFPGDGAVAATSFIGNGQRLSSVGIYYTIGLGNGTPNQGDLNGLTWDFNLWRPSADYIADPWRQTPQQPAYTHRYIHPSNPSWQTVLFQLSNGKDVRYAEVNVNSLNIVTTIGQEYLVTLLPGNASDTVTRVVRANGGTGGQEWYYFPNVPFGPAPAQGYFPAAAPNAAFRVTTTPIKVMSLSTAARAIICDCPGSPCC